MKIIIAPDSFKGSMTSMQASRTIKRAIQEANPLIETVLLPMADGGEGTVDALLWARGGEKVSCRVRDPLGREINAVYGWDGSGKIAFIETAAASGLTLLKREELDPEKSTSYGTGQLMRNALDRGARTIILGLGGSATVDAGTGLFQALGVKFFDGNRKELTDIGGRLDRISSIDTAQLDPAMAAVKIVVASDVTNPLLGEEGAVRIFGPQKGIAEQQIPIFEERMQRFSEIAAKSTGKDRASEPGSGAAGGIGFLLKTLLDTEFRNGLELIVETVQMDGLMEEADLILTGEGRIDGQSLFGKVPVGIGRLAKKSGVPVIAFAGSVGDGLDKLKMEGISAVIPICNGPMTLDAAMANGESLLYEATKRLIKVLAVGTELKKEENS